MATEMPDELLKQRGLNGIYIYGFAQLKNTVIDQLLGLKFSCFCYHYVFVNLSTDLKTWLSHLIMSL